MARTMFDINAKNRFSTSYYTNHHRYDRVGGSLSSRLPTKFLNVLRYFGLYKSAGRTGMDLVLTALVFIDEGKMIGARLP